MNLGHKKDKPTSKKMRRNNHKEFLSICRSCSFRHRCLLRPKDDAFSQSDGGHAYLSTLRGSLWNCSGSVDVSRVDGPSIVFQHRKKKEVLLTHPLSFYHRWQADGIQHWVCRQHQRCGRQTGLTRSYSTLPICTPARGRLINKAEVKHTYTFLHS